MTLSLFAASLIATLLPTKTCARPNSQSASTHVIPVLGVLTPNWHGFGTSLAWWGCEAGGSSLESKYADLFFTNKTTTVTINGKRVSLPGLHLNIVRYNIGGTGRQGDFPGVTEYYNGGVSPTAAGLEWSKLVEGYWVNGISNDSVNWDWSRDSNQRSMLKAAVSRGGVNVVEFFSNAPMWWMTTQKSSLGGNLTEDAFTQYPQYIATVVNHAIKDWKINVTSVSILNEPSSGWWNYPEITQEGDNVPNKTDKVTLMKNLRTQLNAFNLTNVKVSGSEENNADVAYANLDGVLPIVEQFNVHGYQNNNNARGKLNMAVGNIPLWMSEYGDADNRGINMATAILNDMNVMQASAWVYWQVLERQVWGMLYASNFGSTPTDPARAVITDITSKYFVFAQFTRFIRPGDEILNSGHSNVVLAHTPRTKKYKFVVVSYSTSRTVTLNLSGIPKSLPKNVTLTYTNTDGSVLFGKFNSVINNKKIVFLASKNSVYSVEI
ncbi:glycoside hydrolase superfamily [Obelidium mucronatum]|nr:glycoside hydrolase superfamily [Obelidium mucronatum]